MEAFDFDYCDTYESYGSGVRLENNGVRMFTCDDCREETTFVKKGVNDSKFRCDACIQKQNQMSANVSPDSLILNMPLSTESMASDTTPYFSWRWFHFFV